MLVAIWVSVLRSYWTLHNTILSSEMARSISLEVILRKLRLSHSSCVVIAKRSVGVTWRIISPGHDGRPTTNINISSPWFRHRPWCGLLSKALKRRVWKGNILLIFCPIRLQSDLVSVLDISFLRRSPFSVKVHDFNYLLALNGLVKFIFKFLIHVLKLLAFAHWVFHLGSEWVFHKFEAGLTNRRGYIEVSTLGRLRTTNSTRVISLVKLPKHTLSTVSYCRRAFIAALMSSLSNSAWTWTQFFLVRLWERLFFPTLFSNRIRILMILFLRIRRLEHDLLALPIRRSRRLTLNVANCNRRLNTSLHSWSGEHLVLSFYWRSDGVVAELRGIWNAYRLHYLIVLKAS